MRLNPKEEKTPGELGLTKFDVLLKRQFLENILSWPPIQIVELVSTKLSEVKVEY